MQKIKELLYNQKELEKLINTPGITFVGFIQDKMIFKQNVKTSRQLVAKTNTQKFFDIFINKIPNQEILNTIEKELNINIQEQKMELLKFANYWLEKGENQKKAKWEKLGTFEYISRLRTWFSNKRPEKKTNNIGITSI